MEHKAIRVAHFQNEMVKNLVELIGAAGLENLTQLKPRHINHRVSGIDVKTYEELYSTIPESSLTSEKSIPQKWKKNWESTISKTGSPSRMCRMHITELILTCVTNHTAGSSNT